MVTIDELKNLTTQYFRERWEPEKYIQKLLPDELEYIRQQNRVNRSRILVQLVGFSWDPLFVSLCMYKPKKVVLILNKWYNEKEGAGKGDDYIEFIEKIRNRGLIERIPETCPKPHEPLGSDTPEEVFQFLQKHILSLLNEGQEAVIDITGAKKSMVSGAYLFASYTNCPVSYVDYDEYSEEFRRPFGYTCRINELENPSELFRLRDWERVKVLYNQYSFKGAAKLLRDIRECTERFLGGKSEHVAQLEECLEFYGLWDNGDYRSAWNEHQKLSNTMKVPPCPLAVEKLHEIWPDKTNLDDGIRNLEGQDKIEDSIYLKDDEIVTYSRDELEKIERLIRINEDFRSALLRAAGLNEFLLRARVVRLWMEDNFILDIEDKEHSRKNIKGKNLHEADKEILNSPGVRLFLSLRWKPGRNKDVIKFKLESLKTAEGHRSQNAQMLCKFWDGIMDLCKIFVLRNKVIHFCLSIPGDVAVAAEEVARANLGDFEKNWIRNKVPEGNYEAMPWDELLSICGIDFLPKRS
jgi:hypothetical protein